MRAGCRCAFFLLFLFANFGCRNRTDVVEGELRTRETLYREALEEQRRSEARVEALQREVEALRKGSKLLPEQAAQTFGVKRIALGRSTGGYDGDNLPGDEMLQVVIEPRDSDDHTIKAPGTLHILALESSPQGIKTPLSNWDVPADKLRQSWKQGLLSTGYFLTLPWKNLPQYETVRVVVRFVTPDQRVFEADKDVKVRLVPGATQMRRDPVLETLPAPSPLPVGENGPFLVPSSWSPASPRTHTTQWHAVDGPSTPVSLRPSRPLDAPPPPP